jgi:hypothetical protein
MWRLYPVVFSHICKFGPTDHASDFAKIPMVGKYQLSLCRSTVTPTLHETSIETGHQCKNNNTENVPHKVEGFRHVIR